jgi:hypothetical protein
MPLCSIIDRIVGDAESRFGLIFDINAACMVVFETSIIFEAMATSRMLHFFEIK